MMKTVTVSVLGAAGFVGGELIRLLQSHRHVQLVDVTSRARAGQPIGRSLPALRHFPETGRKRFATIEAMREVDIVFSCLPGGVLPKIMEQIRPKARRIINLAGDYRLRDPALLARHYPETAVTGVPADSRYVIPELWQPEYADSSLLNLPGCMAVATFYGLYPLVARGLVESEIVAEAKTGSSGSGKESAEHPAERSHNYRPYMLSGHRHEPEIMQALHDHTGHQVALRFSAGSLDSPRGIAVSSFLTLREGVTELDVRKAFFSTYGTTRFVRYLGPAQGPWSMPMLKTVVGSNAVEVATDIDGRRCTVVSALDNLIKGAAGQGIQAMNLAEGFDEDEGLSHGGMWP
ncbi:N-acetyl-gamma-glutamyl-phosphate reductase 1 [Chitinimonas prasina]|uniref:N-acetyl-gamma-glutamyl-phosphate reductase n=1 Tax=Chitinimonas prasina TaxID=1434937 RepID=A0ABQ5YB65_9NEIS|nr:N-acetyl-gamma-glutamyl-phosphate reductase [Chitinimonas prasina]GLR12195.1 N-acetyl-gamma-glutamyl-phosphate reductase 1 [Chitinimonas prasina]